MINALSGRSYLPELTESSSISSKIQEAERTYLDGIDTSALTEKTQGSGDSFTKTTGTTEQESTAEIAASKSKISSLERKKNSNNNKLNGLSKTIENLIKQAKAKIEDAKKDREKAVEDFKDESEKAKDAKVKELIAQIEGGKELTDNEIKSEVASVIQDSPDLSKVTSDLSQAKSISGNISSELSSYSSLVTDTQSIVNQLDLEQTKLQSLKTAVKQVSNTSESDTTNTADLTNEASAVKDNTQANNSIAASIFNSASSSQGVQSYGIFGSSSAASGSSIGMGLTLGSSLTSSASKASDTKLQTHSSKIESFSESNNKIKEDIQAEYDNIDNDKNFIADFNNSIQEKAVSEVNSNEATENETSDEKDKEKVTA